MKSKNNSVQNSVWLHVVSDKSENFPTSFFFFKKVSSLPYRNSHKQETDHSDVHPGGATRTRPRGHINKAASAPIWIKCSGPSGDGDRALLKRQQFSSRRDDMRSCPSGSG